MATAISKVENTAQVLSFCGANEGISASLVNAGAAMFHI
jgi:hypothetical protein